jgi:hypothetical protein
MANRNEFKSSSGDTQAVLRERDLAERWKVSPRTLQRWRAERYGPAFIRIGGSIRYRMSEVLAFEERRSCGGADVE